MRFQLRKKDKSGQESLQSLAFGRRRSGDRRCYGARAYAIHGEIDLSREDLRPSVLAVVAGAAQRSGFVRGARSGASPYVVPVAAEPAPSGQMAACTRRVPQSVQSAHSGVFGVE